MNQENHHSSESKKCKLFVSYSGEDEKNLAVQLIKMIDFIELIDSGGCYLAENAVMGGDDWRENILGAMRESSHFLSVVSKYNIERPWVQYEFGYLAGSNSRGHCVCVGKVQVPDTMSSLQHITLQSGDSDSLIQKLRDICASINGETELRGKPLEKFNNWVSESCDKGTTQTNIGLIDELVNIIETSSAPQNILAAGKFQNLLQDIGSCLRHYVTSGEVGNVYIYNIELQTLNNRIFWEKIVSNAKVLNLILPENMFLRMEEILLQQENSDESTLELFEKNNNKIKIYVIKSVLGEAPTSYGLFEPASDDDACISYIFPKALPFARLIAEEEGFLQFEYLHFGRTLDANVCDKLLDHAKAAIESAEKRFFDPKRIVSFLSAEKVDVNKVLSIYSVPKKDHEKILNRSFFPKDPFCENISVEIDDPVVFKNHRSEKLSFHNKNSIPSSDSSVYARVISDIGLNDLFDIDKNTEPPFIWLGPWGYHNWYTEAKGINDCLRNAGWGIYDIQYSRIPTSETFSSAEFKIFNTLKYILKFSDHERIGMCFTSINAFIGVSALAKLLEDNDGNLGSRLKLCLLSPAIDLYRSIDSFSDSPLYTRFISMLPEHHTYEKINTPQDVNSRTYFGKTANPWHLFDFLHRGKGTSDFSYFRNCLLLLKEMGVEIKLLYSDKDEMVDYTPAKNINSIMTMMDEYIWYHSLHNGFIIPGTSGKGAISKHPEYGLNKMLNFFKDEEIED